MTKVSASWLPRATIAFALLGAMAGDAHSQVSAQMSDLSNLVRLVAGATNTSNARTRLDAAREIASVVASLGEQQVASLSDQLIDDVAGLVDDDNDFTKVYAANALGSLGTRARRALPALERALERARPADVPTRFSTPHAIRSAIFKIAPEGLAPYLTKLVAEVIGGSTSNTRWMAAVEIWTTVFLFDEKEIDALPEQMVDSIANLVLADPG